MPKPALIVSFLVLMLAALAVVFLMGGGGDSVPQGPTLDQGTEVGAGRLSGDLTAPAEERPEVGEESGRTAVVGSGDLDPDIQKALSGFKGRIVDYLEQPVAACGVRIYRFAMDSVIRPDVGLLGSDFEPEYVAGETQTGDDGRFLITGIWPQAIYMLLGGIGTDNPLNRIVQQTPAPGEIVDLGDIQLNNGAVLVGTVVDPDDQPLAGALVRAVDLPGQMVGIVPVERFDPEGAVIIREEQSPVQVVAMPAWVARAFEHLPIPTTRTGPDGTFRLVGLAPAPNMFAVTMPEFLAEVRPRIVLKPGEERDLGRIRLRKGEMVVGQVVDGEGEPVVGAEVVAGPTIAVAPIDLGSFVGPTDAEGRFQAEGFPRGRVTAAARRGPGHAWVVAEPQSIDQDVLLTLPSRYSLTVSVLDSEGELAAAPTFKLIPGSGEEGIAEMSTLGFIQPVPLDDRLSKTEDGRHLIDDLSEGGYTLLATSPGHAMASVQVQVDGDEEVSVTLAGEVTHRVLVVDMQGEPIRAVAVYAQERGRGAVLEFPVHVGRTRSDGRVSITEISTDQIRLTAKHPAYGMSHAEGSLADGEIVITMRDPGEIEGVLTEKGAVPIPGKWSVFAMQQGGGRGALESVPNFSTPNLEGRFKFPHLQPGRYQVQVINSLDLLSSPGSLFLYAMEVGMGNEVRKTVEVVSGQVSQVTLDISPEIVDGPSARITGVVMVDGRPGTDLRIMVSGDGVRKNAVIDEGGRFDLGYVPEGDVQLALIDTTRTEMFEGPMPRFWNQRITVVANQDVDKIIEIETSSMSGMVFTPDGFAAQSAMLRIAGRAAPGDDSGDQASFTGAVDGQGRFKFDRIPAGIYSLEAFTVGERNARVRLNDIEVLAGLATIDLQVTLIRTVAVSGTVDLSVFGEKRPQFVFVQFESEGGGDDNRTSGGMVDIADNGAFKVEDVLPGTYRIRLQAANSRTRYEHQTTVQIGNADITDLRIHPVPRQDRR